MNLKPFNNLKRNNMISAKEKNFLYLSEILSSRLYNRLSTCLLHKIKDIEHKYYEWTLEDLLFIDESEVKGLRNVGIVSFNEFIYWKHKAKQLKNNI
jgi:hypothetical protein